MADEKFEGDEGEAEAIAGYWDAQHPPAVSTQQPPTPPSPVPDRGPLHYAYSAPPPDEGEVVEEVVATGELYQPPGGTP
jgi:hypothetical protein